MIHVQDHIYYKGGPNPQYTIMMSLQKFGSCVSELNTILHNLGYRCEPKVFVIIQRNQYNLGHANRCVEVEHGKDSIDCQSIGDNLQLKQRNSPIMKVSPRVPLSKL